MKSTLKDWLKVLVLLLDELVVVVVAFLVLRWLEIDIPLPVAVVGVLALGGLIFIIHRAIIPSFHRKQVTGAEGLIGLEGEVVEPLTPVGAVRIKGEYWKAKSTGENVAAGEEVQILAIKGLTLIVKPKNEKA